MLRQQYPERTTKEIARTLNRSVSSVYQKACTMGLKKSKAFWEDPMRNGAWAAIESGKKSRFTKGHVPHNKGVPSHEYLSEEKAEKIKRTQFKPGHLPHNTKAGDGVESIRRDKRGNRYVYVRISINNWQQKHRLVWQEHNGPIPSGHNVQFKDGDSTNCDIGNLYLISRADQLNTENGIHAYPAETKETIRLIKQLQKTINNHETK